MGERNDDGRDDITIQLIPGGSGRTRSFRLSGRWARLARIATVAAPAVLVLLAISWVVFAWQARQAHHLRADLAEAREQLAVVDELADALAQVEGAYARLTALFGPESQAGTGSGPFLPPAGGRAMPGAPAPAEGPPSAWPLADRGFITQPLVEGAEREHPGIDIAVPTGTYILAAGLGRVVEAADDPVYGLHLLLDHGQGYRSLYAHASLLLARPGDIVRPGEVIGLTGSTGRSTAPHLHFEILRDGRPVNPLDYVRQP